MRANMGLWLAMALVCALTVASAHACKPTGKIQAGQATGGTPALSTPGSGSANGSGDGSGSGAGSGAAEGAGASGSPALHAKPTLHVHAAMTLPAPRPLVIPRLTDAPRLEDFLSGKARGAGAAMVEISRFVERYPEDGNRPADATEAYLGYTHTDLYAAFVCRQRDPADVRGHMLARDGLSDDDNVALWLDTFHDQRRAFVFQSNPLGIQADALYSEQSGFDYSFDTVWDTWGKRTDFGYVVVMRIPFASLYFAKTDPGALRTWGVILQRNVAETGESDYWPRIAHDVAGRLTQDAAVEGFADVARGRNVQLEAYSLARNLRQLNSVDAENPFISSKHLQGFTGLDAKVILHNSLVLDATLNPDFSQVGIDNPAAPNQRFPSFFAEMRPFFIENSSYFMTPINLYYTNNIGLPQVGARLTGKAGRWALGLLGVDDRGPGVAVPQGDPLYGTRAHFYEARVNRDVGEDSNVGLIYADREYMGSYNRAGGVDYRMRLGERWTLTGQAVTSETANLSSSTAGEQGCLNSNLRCSGQAYFQKVTYSDLHRGWGLGYNDTAAGYVTDTGFFRRPDVRTPNGYYSYTFRPSGGPVLSHGPSVYAERDWDHSGTPLDLYIEPSYNVNFANRSGLSAWLSMSQDRLRPIDFSTLTSNREYHSKGGGMSFWSSPVPYLAVSGGFRQGTTINYSPPGNDAPGEVNVVSPRVSLEVKPLHDLDMQNRYVFTHFSNPASGATVYDNHELTSRWNLQMTKAASVNLIGQYISTLPDAGLTSAGNQKTLFADALFTYMPHPGTALYFGYIGNFANLDRGLCTRMDNGMCNPADPVLPTTTGDGLMNDGKMIYMKLSYLLRF
ncbi:MAG TPA: DUF5916 domain-containing protein [Terracidiphilus sp.]|nr:DUF5916 domain-containing protein [Terracidiphilus sp.]